MKIFRFVTDTKLPRGECGCAMNVLTIPDTALLIQKRPFFIPDFATNCTAALCVAVRINRLGRSINRRFANRYYDLAQTTLGVHFIASDLLEILRSAGKPWDIAVGFDNAVAVSEQKETRLDANAAVAMCINQTKYETVVPCNFYEVVDIHIAHISQYYTLRQGDILLFPLELPVVPYVHIDDHIRLEVLGSEVLAFNVK